MGKSLAERATPRPRTRPITDGTLTDAERWRLLTDPRTEDGVFCEWLSRRERDRLVFLAWLIEHGMVTP